MILMCSLHTVTNEWTDVLTDCRWCYSVALEVSAQKHLLSDSYSSSLPNHEQTPAHQLPVFSFTEKQDTPPPPSMSSAARHQPRPSDTSHRQLYRHQRCLRVQSDADLKWPQGLGVMRRWSSEMWPCTWWRGGWERAGGLFSLTWPDPKGSV